MEEYFPFGQTAYSAASGVAETSLKRYRFVGKERDEETGLYYIGARYYASWLGRWTAVDPLARGGPRNGYVYAGNRPLDVVDPDGRQEHVLDTEAGQAGVDQPATAEVRNEARRDAFYARVNARQDRIETTLSGVGAVHQGVTGALVGRAWETKDEVSAYFEFMGKRNPLTVPFFLGSDIAYFVGEPEKHIQRAFKGVVSELEMTFTGAAALFTGDFETYSANHPYYRRVGNLLGAIKEGERIVPAAIELFKYGEGLVADAALSGAGALASTPSRTRVLKSSVGLRGKELASAELIEAIASKTGIPVVLAKPGDSWWKLLEESGANALYPAGTSRRMIILRHDARKIEVLEEWLHHVQDKAGMFKRLPYPREEIHVKDFMIRHRRMLGISVGDAKVLQKMLRKQLESKVDINFEDLIPPASAFMEIK